MKVLNVSTTTRRRLSIYLLKVDVKADQVMSYESLKCSSEGRRQMGCRASLPRDAAQGRYGRVCGRQLGVGGVSGLGGGRGACPACVCQPLPTRARPTLTLRDTLHCTLILSRASGWVRGGLGVLVWRNPQNSHLSTECVSVIMIQARIPAGRP